MSEHASKPLLSDSTVAYFGVVAAVIVAAAVFGVAYGLRTADTPAVNADLRERRVTFRQELEGGARQRLAGYGKSEVTPGAFRIPADKAAEILVSDPDAALAALRAGK